MLRPLVAQWCPRAFVVSFKLETDPGMLEPKARRALDDYGHRLVVANMLQTRAHQVTLVERNQPLAAVELSAADHAAGTELEDHIIREVLQRHQAFVAETA